MRLVRAAARLIYQVAVYRAALDGNRDLAEYYLMGEIRG